MAATPRDTGENGPGDRPEQPSGELDPAAVVSELEGSAASPGFRRLTLMSLLAGASQLIPVPFVDDWCLRLVRRRAVSDLLRRSGLPADGGEVRALAGERRESERGCLLGALGLAVKAVLYFVGKVFKKLVFVLTLRDCARRASELFGEGYVLRHAVAVGAAEDSLSPGGIGAAGLRSVVEAVLERAGSGPTRWVVSGVLKGSWGELARAARLLRRTLARRRSGGATAVAAVPVEEEERALAGLSDRLSTALWMEAEYRGRLERLFDALYYDSSSADRRSDEGAGDDSGA